MKLAAKSKYEEVFSIHIYSLEPSTIPVGSILISAFANY